MRFAGALLLLVAGAATALATVALHQLWWGLLLGALATVAALVALGRGWLTRLPFGLGFAGFLVYVVPPRGEGDFVVSSDAFGLSLLGFALGVLVFSVGTLPRPRRAAGSVGDHS